MEPSAYKRIARALSPRLVRNWLRAPKRSAAWVWSELKFYAGVVEIHQLRPGWFVRCHPAAYPFGYWFQEWDPSQVAELDAFIASCSPGMILYDVGAHFGVFSLAALHYGGPEARAVAVDPSPSAQRMLRLQSRLNRAAERLSLIQAAASDSGASLDLVSAGPYGHGYFTLPLDHSGGELSRVPAYSLDWLAERLRLMPTHVKIDVEGQELAVLQGAKRLLATSRPIVFLELHTGLIREHGGDPRAPLALLRDLGYRCFSHEGQPMDEESLLASWLTRFVARLS